MTKSKRSKFTESIKNRSPDCFETKIYQRIEGKSKKSETCVVLNNENMEKFSQCSVWVLFVNALGIE